jgi:phosphoheptose isomerase
MKSQEIEAEAPYLSSTLSKDGNLLICGNFKGFVDIFQFNLVSEKFELFQKLTNCHESFV